MNFNIFLILSPYFYHLDLSSLPGTKLQSRGKKRENVLPKSPSAGIPTGSVPAGSKNQKPWLPKQKGPDKKQQRTCGVVGSGTNRKNYHQVMCVCVVLKSMV